MKNENRQILTCLKQQNIEGEACKKHHDVIIITLSPSQISYPTHTRRGDKVYCIETINNQACRVEDNRHN